MFNDIQMKRTLLLISVLLLALFSCTHHQEKIDSLHRSKVDALNKLSFQNRLRDASLCEKYARQALVYINDSLPQYEDGKLRAWNNIATSFYFRAIHDSVMVYVDSVLKYNGKCHNKEVEQVLAHLLEARLRQRNCDIAGSYQILYDIEQSDFINNDNNDLLYNLAKSEFYITTTVLNYHYRSRSLDRHGDLLAEMERNRDKLRCDYAEDMSFNYALAYGYYAMCNDTSDQAVHLNKALSYCADNLWLMNDSARYSTYHLGDTYQLLGFMLWSRNILPESWDYNKEILEDICTLVNDAFGFDVASEPDMAFAFLREATALFWLHDDPYQRLGAIVSTGRYSMYRGDTATAREYFNEALIDTSMFGVAPKFEAMLYEGFLTAGCAANLDEVAEWSRKEIELLNYIKQNERADFLLQNELAKVKENSHLLMLLSLLLLVLALGLVTTLILLRRRTKALQKETLQLQEAKQKDFERIANVETCLSVLRHDINPFISYLQNDKLPEELKHEVTGQLIRTFENIKNWTNLSIPNGLQFRCSTVSLQEVFDEVESNINNFKSGKVALSFLETDLTAKGDRQLLMIMLRNLVNNALQYTDEGYITVNAEIYANNGKFIKVNVSDTGRGMSAYEVDNLFRTDKTPRQNSGEKGYGSGFGLILCRYIIKKHDDNTLRGCRIWAESTEGKGTTFSFLIEKA